MTYSIMLVLTGLITGIAITALCSGNKLQDAYDKGFAAGKKSQADEIKKLKNKLEIYRVKGGER